MFSSATINGRLVEVKRVPVPGGGNLSMYVHRIDGGAWSTSSRSSLASAQRRVERIVNPPAPRPRATPKARGARAAARPAPTPTVRPSTSGPPLAYTTAEQRRLGGEGIPRFREQQREALGRALASGDLTEARRIVRGLIAEDGVVSRDVLENRRLTARVLTTPASATGARATHYWDGAVTFANDVPLTATGRWLAAGGRVTGTPYFEAHLIQGRNSLAHALNTVIHEELHGCSPITSNSYFASRKVLEEVGTELQARALTQRLIGSPSGSTSYNSYIDQVRMALPASYRDRYRPREFRSSEEMHVNADARLVTAFQETWKTQRTVEGNDYADALARHLPDATPAERAAFRLNLAGLND